MNLVLSSNVRLLSQCYHVQLVGAGFQHTAHIYAHQITISTKCKQKSICRKLILLPIIFNIFI